MEAEVKEGGQYFKIENMSDQTPDPKPQRAGQDARIQVNFMSTWATVIKISILGLMILFEESKDLASETLLFAGNLFKQYINDSESFSTLPSPLSTVPLREQQVSEHHTGRER